MDDWGMGKSSLTNLHEGQDTTYKTMIPILILFFYLFVLPFPFALS